MILASRLKDNKKLDGEVFNFGPGSHNNHDVQSLVQTMELYWKNVNWKIKKNKIKNHFESTLLKLNCNKASKILGWRSVLNFKETTKLTISWYKEFYNNKKNIQNFSIDQIKYYERVLERKL